MHRVEEGETAFRFPTTEVEGRPCPEVLIDGSEVTEYADLQSMCRDFEHVMTMCRNASSIVEDTSIGEWGQLIGFRATWESAVMAYARAFRSGVSAGPGGGARTRFPKAILDALDSDQLAVHRRTLELRDKHVGHRVNDWEKVVVTAILSPEGVGEPRVLDIRGKGFTMVGGKDRAEQLLRVTSTLRDGLLERIDAVKADMLDQLRRHPIEALYEASHQQERQVPD